MCLKCFCICFAAYLFDNKIRDDNVQVYENIIKDIKPLMEDNYSVYVTGHRYVQIIFV